MIYFVFGRYDLYWYTDPIETPTVKHNNRSTELSAKRLYSHEL